MSTEPAPLRTVTRGEALWLITAYTLCANHLFVPQLLYDVYGRTSWLLPLLGTMGGILGSYAATSLSLAISGLRIGQALRARFGPWLALVLAVPFLLTWLGGATIDAIWFAVYVSSTSLPETPFAVVASLSVGLTAYMCSLGIRNLIRVVDLLFFLVVPVLVVYIGWAFLNDRVDWLSLLPIDLAGLVRINTIPIFTSLIHGHLVVLIIEPVMANSKRDLRVAAMGGTIIAGLIFLAYVAGPMLIFGWPEAGRYAYPGSALYEVIELEPLFPIRRIGFIISMLMRYLMSIALFSYFTSYAWTLKDVVRGDMKALWGSIALGVAVIACCAVLPIQTFESIITGWLIATTVTFLEVMALWLLYSRRPR